MKDTREAEVEGMEVFPIDDLGVELFNLADSERDPQDRNIDRDDRKGNRRTAIPLLREEEVRRKERRRRNWGKREKKGEGPSRWRKNKV